MTNSACSSGTAYSSSDITGRMLCASNPGKDACQGDSGGPLMGTYPETDQVFLAGVVSWGIGNNYSTFIQACSSEGRLQKCEYLRIPSGNQNQRCIFKSANSREILPR